MTSTREVKIVIRVSSQGVGVSWPLSLSERGIRSASVCESVRAHEQMCACMRTHVGVSAEGAET